MKHVVIPLGLAAVLLGPLAQAATDAAMPPSLQDQRPAQPYDAAETQGVLTLDNALALAIARSPRLSAAQQELASTEGGITQARTIPNPAVGYEMEDTRRASRTTTAQLSVPIELGGKRSARIDAAQKTRELASAQLSNAEADLRAAVIGAFFQVLVAQERVSLAESSVGIATRGTQAAARRVAAGKVSPVEQTRAEVEQANAELELAEARATLDAARQQLAAQWGSQLPVFASASGDLEALPSRPLPNVLDEALDTAPEMRASQSEMARRQAVVNVERSRQYPDVTVSVGAKREYSSDRGYYPVLGVSLPLPLFDRNQGNLYTAIRQADKAADESRATRVRLASDLRQASGQLALSRNSALTLRQTVLPAAQRAYQAASQGFEAGKFAYLEVLDAQRTLLQARVRYLGAVAATYQAATAIDRMLGR
ncbi:TolC family protein [Cupriavidus numazuensis]|uniref:Cobalt-zinc-cadmium resistance protein CzcC n=1 Tax=Cupriavidus numazuensis TaxID=221992 RepID=A0ABM8TAT7_9BURK|nr:TolC family protein [Cupriavidus numazuensis]CAG2131903.1 Cobalt-zinc-cadmium resistance protein CzcC [Cupriavidus numazuensis]